LKKGQEINAVITNIDTENRRLSLSIKDTEPSAWDKFINEHKPGDIVHGRVTRFANFGAFVELAEGLEGLCHVSELSDDRVEKPEDAAQIGQEMDFRILRIEQESKKIGLSARAAKHDEPIMDTKSYTSDVGGGMASLGELADFFPRRSEEPTASAPASEVASEPASESVSESGSESTGESNSEPAVEAASESTSEPTGESAGESAGEPASQAAGESAGESVSEAADASAGESAAEPSGEPAAEASGESTGETSGDSTGETSGESEGESSNG
jgi:predicted RNA-binding protein with RPS1 domain